MSLQGASAPIQASKRERSSLVVATLNGSSGSTWEVALRDLVERELRLVPHAQDEHVRGAREGATSGVGDRLGGKDLIVWL